MINLKEQKNNVFIHTLKDKFCARQSFLEKTNYHQEHISINGNIQNPYSISTDSYLQLYQCHECGEMFPVDDMITTQDSPKVCYDCYESLYTTCEICGAVIPLSTVNTLSFGSEDIETCSNCAVQLNTVLKEKEEPVTLLHHHMNDSSDFIQFDFNIVMQQPLNSNAILNIVNSISDICSIHDVPLFYFKKVDNSNVLNFTTHFLDLNADLYKEIILKLASYIAFEPNILYLDSFHLRIECSKEKQSIYYQMMNTLLMNLFHKKSIFIKTLESAESITLSSDSITDILDKANFYRTCLRNF